MGANKRLAWAADNPPCPRCWGGEFKARAAPTSACETWHIAADEPCGGFHSGLRSFAWRGSVHNDSRSSYHAGQSVGPDVSPGTHSTYAQCAKLDQRKMWIFDTPSNVHENVAHMLLVRRATLARSTRVSFATLHTYIEVFKMRANLHLFAVHNTSRLSTLCE